MAAHVGYANMQAYLDKDGRNCPSKTLSRLSNADAISMTATATMKRSRQATCEIKCGGGGKGRRIATIHPRENQRRVPMCLELPLTA